MRRSITTPSGASGDADTDPAPPPGGLNVSHHRSNLVESASPLEQEAPMEHQTTVHQQRKSGQRTRTTFYATCKCGWSESARTSVSTAMKDASMHEHRVRDGLDVRR